jgi:glycerophosphoryl diester phosphodiesterase
VNVWTVNDERIMRRLVDLGADGIITDRPDTLRRLLDEEAG